MGMVGEADLNFWIVRGIARRMDVSVSDAMYDGQLSRAAFVCMVERCRVCRAASDCLGSMAEATGPVPDCENTRELAALHV